MQYKTRQLFNTCTFEIQRQKMLNIFFIDRIATRFTEVNQSHIWIQLLENICVSDWFSLNFLNFFRHSNESKTRSRNWWKKLCQFKEMWHSIHLVWAANSWNVCVVIQILYFIVQQRCKNFALFSEKKSNKSKFWKTWNLQKFLFNYLE